MFLLAYLFDLTYSTSFVISSKVGGLLTAFFRSLFTTVKNGSLPDVLERDINFKPARSCSNLSAFGFNMSTW